MICQHLAEMHRYVYKNIYSVIDHVTTNNHTNVQPLQMRVTGTLYNDKKVKLRRHVNR